MKKPQVWHYHYDSSGHARKHLHFGGRVRHEHVNLYGYGQFTETLHNNERSSGERRGKYFGRSTPSRVDAETAMNPGAARHRQEAVSLYKEARATDSERRKEVLQIRAAEHVQSAIESEAEGIPNPSEHIDNRQTGVWDSATLTEILRQLRRLVDKSGKKGLIVTRDNSKGIAEVKGARTGKLFLRAMQVHGGWMVRWDGKLIQRKGENPNRKWHEDRYKALSGIQVMYPHDNELKGQVLEETLALYDMRKKNPEIEVRCAFCGKTIRSIKTAKMYRGKKSLCGLELSRMIVSSDIAAYGYPLCRQCKGKISNMLGGSHPYIENPLVDVDSCLKCHRKRGEKHKATMKAPSVKTMEKWMSDSKCKATDGCWVEPDGTCPHGHGSWMLRLGYI